MDLGMEVVETGRDGDCLFHALVAGAELAGVDVCTVRELRTRTVRYIRSHEEPLGPRCSCLKSVVGFRSGVL